MENIVRVNKQKDFTIMSNHHLRNENLSWKAKGIHSYILSLPDDWKVIIEHLKKVSTDREKSTRTGIKELYDARYWQKYPVYKDGRVSTWITEIYEHPFPAENKIKNIIIRNGIETINYEKDDVKEDKELLVQKGEVGEHIENTTSELLCPNVEIGGIEVDSLEQEREGLLNTNNTKDLSFTNNSFNQSFKDKDLKEEMNEGMNENIDRDIEELEEILDKAEVNKDYLGDNYYPIKRAIESLYYRNINLNVNGMSIPPAKIRKDLLELNSFHVDMGMQIFKEQSRDQKISNRISYLATCIYTSIFDMELKIQNDLFYDDIL